LIAFGGMFGHWQACFPRSVSNRQSLDAIRSGLRTLFASKPPND
jgi:hypothetical protein